MRDDETEAKAVIGQLSGVIDPIGLMAWIDKRSRYGERAGAAPWEFSGEFLTQQGLVDRLDWLKDVFARVGVKDELDASVWLAEHDALIQ